MAWKVFGSVIRASRLRSEDPRLARKALVKSTFVNTVPPQLVTLYERHASSVGRPESEFGSDSVTKTKKRLQTAATEFDSEFDRCKNAILALRIGCRLQHR